MENRKKSSVLYITIALTAFGAGWGVCSITSDSSRQTMELTFPGGSGLKIDTTAPQIAHGKLLDDIFAQQFSRDGLMGWLADKDIFSFGDVRLVEALNNRLCGSIPGQPLDQKIRASQNCANLPVAAGLRQLVSQKRVPFHYVGVSVQVGIPAREHQPQLGWASVCEDSELRSKRVELTNLRTPNRIEIQASGTYRCTGFTKFPDIQLSFKDALALFPGPFNELQEAVAVVLN